MTAQCIAWVAQSVERETLNLKAQGSTPCPSAAFLSSLAYGDV